MNQLKMHLATRFFQKGRIYTWTTDLSQTAKSSNNNNNNNNIYTGGVLTLSGFRNGPVYRSSPKAMPIKCFVSHRPPSREGGSVGRAKKK